MQEPLFEGVTLIEDGAECSGQSLIGCFVKKAAARFTNVVVALFDNSKESFEQRLSSLPTSVTVLDFYKESLPSFADYEAALSRGGSLQKGVLFIESLTALQWVHGGGVDRTCS
uniref:KaiC-like domain-containing protein n=1 Tax=Plectus sambesii TaxID=2011161 RepID=A0A914XDI3_9BILA